MYTQFNNFHRQIFMGESQNKGQLRMQKGRNILKSKKTSCCFYTFLKFRFND